MYILNIGTYVLYIYIYIYIIYLGKLRTKGDSRIYIYTYIMYILPIYIGVIVQETRHR